MLLDKFNKLLWVGRISGIALLLEQLTALLPRCGAVDAFESLIVLVPEADEVLNTCFGGLVVLKGVGNGEDRKSVV
jgi:hypothetical protein